LIKLNAQATWRGITDDMFVLHHKFQGTSAVTHEGVIEILDRRTKTVRIHHQMKMLVGLEAGIMHAG
jgi:hypothetical protein